MANKVSLRPLGDRVLVQRDQSTTKTRRVREPAVKKGDRVLFGQYAGSDLKIGDVDNVVVLREGDIFGVIEGG